MFNSKGAKDQKKMNAGLIKKYIHNLLQKDRIIKSGKIFRALDGVTLSEINKVLKDKTLNFKVQSHNQRLRNK